MFLNSICAELDDVSRGRTAASVEYRYASWRATRIVAMRSSFYAERVAQEMTALPPKADIELILS